MQQSKSNPIIFILSIDTEEEWDWSGAFPQHNADVNNVALLPSFHKHLGTLGLRPTYLVDYAVADCSINHARDYCQRKLRNWRSFTSLV